MGWRRQKLDRLGSLDEEGKEKEGILQAGAAETSRALRSHWGWPLGDPRASLLGSTTRAGLQELTYFGAEAALGRAEGDEREQGEQQTAGGQWGRRHGPRPCGLTGRAAPRRGPSPAVAPPRPRAPLSSGGTEFGFLER